MYTVYADKALLCHPVMDDLKLTEAKTAQDLNTTGSFVFTIYPDNPYIGSLKKMKTLIRIYDDADLIFRGRVLNTARGFYNQQTVTCEGELSFFLDSVQRPYEYKGSVSGYFEKLIVSHNEQVDEERRFKVGRCTVTDPNDFIVRSDTQYLNTWESLQEKLVKKLGGYLWVRHEADGNYIDYLEDFDTLNMQDIEFGENLLSFEETIKGQDIATAVIPLGCRLKDAEERETGERLTVAEINGGADYVYHAEAVEKYGWIFKTMVWDDVTVAENLLRKGREALGDYVGLVRSVELTAVDLHNLNKDIQSFRIGNYTKVRSAPHDLDEMLLTRKLELNLLNAADGKLWLGDERQTFVDKQAETTNHVNQMAQRVESVEADYAINEAKVEYLTKVLADFKNTAVISDTEPEDKGCLWCDTSEVPAVLKRWDGEKWEVVNDNAEQITQIYQDITSAINQASDNIRIMVGERTYQKDEIDRLIGDINTEYSQTKDTFNFQFHSFQSTLDVFKSTMETQFQNTTKYIRFIDGAIYIGIEGNPMVLKQSNDRISFLENNMEVAYISNRTMYITHAEVLKDLKIGRFAWVYMDSGYLPLKKVQ